MNVSPIFAHVNLPEMERRSVTSLALERYLPRPNYLDVEMQGRIGTLGWAGTNEQVSGGCTGGVNFGRDLHWVNQMTGS